MDGVNKALSLGRRWCAWKRARPWVLALHAWLLARQRELNFRPRSTPRTSSHHAWGPAQSAEPWAQVVRVEAGVTLGALHAWLLARQRELSFSPEIGDATVGGLVTTMCKDSSVRGPGHLSALVEALTYVNHEGTVSPSAPYFGFI